MLYTFLLILLVLDSLVLVAAVLMQSGKGGGLAASFGGASSTADALIGSRQAGNLLTKVSWWSGGIFLFLAFVLQIASTRSRTPTSVLDQPMTQQAAPVAPPTTGTTPNSAVPLTPQGKAAEQPATKQPDTTKK
jgi:preprotein translocase subunit SecG